MARKDQLAELLEKYLPKLTEQDPEEVRECLRMMLKRLEFKQYLLAVEHAKDPLAFGYNLYLWTQGMTKEVRGAGTLRMGKTYKEKQLAKGYQEHEINEDDEAPFTSNAMIEVQDGGWIRLGRTARE